VKIYCCTCNIDILSVYIYTMKNKSFSLDLVQSVSFWISHFTSCRKLLLLNNEVIDRLFDADKCKYVITELDSISFNTVSKNFFCANEIESSSVITYLHLSASKSRSITSLFKRSSLRHEVKCDIQNDTDWTRSSEKDLFFIV
jgi:hypothetical protein